MVPIGEFFLQFDLFHSFGKVDLPSLKRRPAEVFQSALSQAQLGDALGLKTFWVAESHFSSEVQKAHHEAVIPNYSGEVGLNADSFQLFWLFRAVTKKMGFGTAILNIVGGNGGPISAADRVQTLCFLNGLQSDPRDLWMGVAAGRFPYINKPFGIHPRNDYEKLHWSKIKNIIFLEALEIFLELLQGRSWGTKKSKLNAFLSDRDLKYSRFWNFEELLLVPSLENRDRDKCRFVLGSTDPRARSLALAINDIDIFNLSFTPPQEIETLHLAMSRDCIANQRRLWHRSRLPRTVMVFIDRASEKAHRMANRALDTYIEAMQGTAQVPDKEILLSRALIGDPIEIKEQLDRNGVRKFHPEDRLMLWFEFNQTNHQDICDQMSLFCEKVMPDFA